MKSLFEMLRYQRHFKQWLQSPQPSGSPFDSRVQKSGVCMCVMYNHSSLFSGGQAVVVAQGTLSVDVYMCAM